MILIYIGVGIIIIGVSLFLYSFYSAMKNKEGPLYEFIEKQKIKKENNKKLDIIREGIKHEAKIQALFECKDEMVRVIKEKEIKKMTGEHRKDKMQKFANAFSMGGNNNSHDKINQMLGVNTNINNNTINDNYNTNKNDNSINNKKIKKENNNIDNNINNNENDFFNKMNNMLGNEKNNTSNIFSTDKINMMMGKTSNNKNSKEDETKRILNFLK